MLSPKAVAHKKRATQHGSTRPSMSPRSHFKSKQVKNSVHLAEIPLSALDTTQHTSVAIQKLMLLAHPSSPSFPCPGLGLRLNLTTSL